MSMCCPSHCTPRASATACVGSVHAQGLRCVAGDWPSVLLSSILYRDARTAPYDCSLHGGRDRCRADTAKAESQMPMSRGTRLFPTAYERYSRAGDLRSCRTCASRTAAIAIIDIPELLHVGVCSGEDCVAAPYQAGGHWYWTPDIV
ncbi:hypothetical protein BD309DRAFT_949203 [Dichomitus squalens]|nr:hypothetical protein BD309DRAFT_949203 [Dichomitus squalens]